MAFAVISICLAALLPASAVRDGIVLFVGLVVSLSLHEFGHAAMAVWLGDDTPRNPARLTGGRVVDLGTLLGVNRGRDNRYTVNPLAHADPIGTVVLPLAAIFLIPGGMLFGWGRPVPFNPYGARRSISRQTMIILVSLAGPLMNILQCLAYSVLLYVLVLGNASVCAIPIVEASVRWVELLILLNVILACFNLLPVPPLDGGHILVYSLRRTHPDWAQWLQQYGLFVFILLIPILPFLLQPVVVGTQHWTQFLIRVAGG